MIDQIASSAAIALLNRALGHEQWARDKLAPFAGRSARFDAAPFALTLQVTGDGTFARGRPRRASSHHRRGSFIFATCNVGSYGCDERHTA